MTLRSVLVQGEEDGIRGDRIIGGVRFKCYKSLTLVGAASTARLIDTGMTKIACVDWRGLAAGRSIHMGELRHCICVASRISRT